MDAPLSTNKWLSLCNQLIHANDDTFAKDIFNHLLRMDRKIYSLFAAIRDSHQTRHHFELVIKRASEVRIDAHDLHTPYPRDINSMSCAVSHKILCIEEKSSLAMIRKPIQELLDHELIKQKVAKIKSESHLFLTEEEVLDRVFKELIEQYNNPNTSFDESMRASNLIKVLDGFDLQNVKSYPELLFSLIIKHQNTGSQSQWGLIQFPPPGNQALVSSFLKEVISNISITGSLIVKTTQFYSKLFSLVNQCYAMHGATNSMTADLEVQLRKVCKVLHKLAPRSSSDELRKKSNSRFDFRFPDGLTVTIKLAQYAAMVSNVPCLKEVGISKRFYDLPEGVDSDAFQKMIEIFYPEQPKYIGMYEFAASVEQFSFLCSNQDFFRIAKVASTLKDKMVWGKLKHSVQNAMHDAHRDAQETGNFALIFGILNTIKPFLEKNPIQELQEVYNEYIERLNFDFSLRLNHDSPKILSMLNYADVFPSELNVSTLSKIDDIFGNSYMWYGNVQLFTDKLTYLMSLLRAELVIKRKSALSLSSKNLQKLIQEALYIDDRGLRNEVLRKIKEAFPETVLTRKGCEKVLESEADFGEWEEIKPESSDVALELDLTSNETRGDRTFGDFFCTEVFGIKPSFSLEKLLPLEGLNITKFKFWDNVKDLEKIKTRFPKANIEILPTPKGHPV